MEVLEESTNLFSKIFFDIQKLAPQDATTQLAIIASLLLGIVIGILSTKFLSNKT